MTVLEPGEVHTSKGGFTVAERNNSSELAELIVIEPMKAEEGEFHSPMGGFRFHDAALSELFERSAVRAYAMRIAPTGRTEKHREDYDSLLVATSDLRLREEVEGQGVSNLEMKAGDVKWLPLGMVHATTNIGDLLATFVIFEFR
jgi:hypothetical protein